MKRHLRWVKISPRLAEGYLGDAMCFHISKEHNQVVLISDLPSLRKDTFGRSVTFHKTGRGAADKAETLLTIWLEKTGLTHDK